MGDDVMVMRRAISALVEVVMKKGLRSSHTVLSALAIYKLRTVIFVERRSSVRRWNLPLEKTVCELNLMARDVACWRAMHAYLAHDVMRARLDTKPRKEEISLKVKLLRLGCQVLRSMCSSSIRLSSRMPK